MMRFRKINIADVDMKLSLHFKYILTAWKPSFVILMKSDLTFIETIRLDLWQLSYFGNNIICMVDVRFKDV